ncbi:MAG TPA: mismatch repair protein [Terriglobales bacterium]|nr:mismatch repair protein [Terriglobales bacterium]
MHAAEEYRERLQHREIEVHRLEAVHVRLGNMRLFLALVAVGIAWESLKQHALSPGWTALPLILFAGIAIYHARLLKARDLAQRAVGFYENGLARIENRWVGTGQTGERFNDPHHVYAEDLGLFGRGSLFELLSTARTRMGEEALAGWLLTPSAVEEIAERQAAVRALRQQLDLREDLAVVGKDAGVGVYGKALLSWAEAPNRMGPQGMRWLSLILGVSALAAAALWGWWGRATPLIVILVLEAVLKRRLGKPLAEVLDSAEHAFRDLGLLSGLLARVERHAFSAPRLQLLQRQLISHGLQSSRAIARLNTILELSDSRRNLILAALDIPLMYSVQVAFAAEAWRRTHGRAVGSWLGAIAEIEALISLATYSYEHPGDPFPEFVHDAAYLDAAEMGHPLIPPGSLIRNSVRLVDEVRVLLVFCPINKWQYYC